jgi:hypothetical protein
VNGFYDHINNKLTFNTGEFDNLSSHLGFSSFSLEYLKRYNSKGKNSVDKIKSYKLTYLQSTSTNKKAFVDDFGTYCTGSDNSFNEINIEYKLGKRLKSNFFYMVNGMVYFSKYKVSPYLSNNFGFKSTRIGTSFGIEGGYQVSLFDRVDMKFSLNYNPFGIYYEIFRSENPNLNASRLGPNRSVKFNVLQRRIMFTVGVALFQSTKKSRRRIRR